MTRSRRRVWLIQFDELTGRIRAIPSSQVHRQGATWTRYRATNLVGGGSSDVSMTCAVWRAPDGDLFCIGDGGVVVRYDF